MANYGRCGLADFITLSHRRSYFNFSEDRHSPPFSTRGDWDTRLAGSFDKARLVSSGPNTFLVLVTRATARVSTVSLALTPTIPRDFSLLGTASLPSPFQQSTTVLVMDHAKRLGHGKVWATRRLKAFKEENRAFSTSVGVPVRRYVFLTNAIDLRRRNVTLWGSVRSNEEVIFITNGDRVTERVNGRDDLWGNWIEL